MEKAQNVLMVPANFKWDDVGTWASLQRVLDLDGKGNYTRGDTICIDTHDCVVVGDERVIGAIGVSEPCYCFVEKRYSRVRQRQGTGSAGDSKKHRSKEIGLACRI